MNAVELQNLTKSFGNHIAVNDLSLSVPTGSVYGFIGPNGSGKTTTLRMIMNIILPDSGNVLIYGSPLTSSLCDNIGYMPEERGLYKRMKARELLLFFGNLMCENNTKAKVDDWLERLDLTMWAHKKLRL
jgi:ABC-2 type transport system ATP-binding protein